MKKIILSRISRLANFNYTTNMKIESNTLQTVLREFAPELLDRKELLDDMQAYVFHSMGDSPLEHSERNHRLRLGIEASISPQNNVFSDDLVLIMEGMRTLFCYYELNSAKDLDDYIGTHKRAFGFLLGRQMQQNEALNSDKLEVEPEDCQFLAKKLHGRKQNDN